MRKRIIAPTQHETASPDQDWLNLEALAEVEITSEDAAHPVESAVLPGDAAGWRATGPGKQTMRLLFGNPQRLRRIWLAFVETQTERTQQYVLRWSADGGRSFHEIVRQQWNFSPPWRNPGARRPSRRSSSGHGTRVEHHSGHKWGNGPCLFGAVAARLIPRSIEATNRVAVETSECPARQDADSSRTKSETSPGRKFLTGLLSHPVSSLEHAS